MDALIANDDSGAVSLEDAEALLGEIARLRAEIARLEARVTELDQLAHRDSLVDLLNRRGFVASLENLIARVSRYRESAAMLFVDLDGLKQINDKFGHDAGDAALFEVGQVILTTARKSDCVARIGGDEFGVLLERADEVTAWQIGLRVVEKVMELQFCVNGISLPLSVAVGVGVIRAGDSPASVMRRADKAMYRIKAT